MKKFLYSALALPLLFACSTDEIEKQVVSNDQFSGIEKVDATFTLADEGSITRMDQKDDGTYTGWSLANGDLYGFAWLGDGTVVKNTDGYANQNHNLIQTDGIFKPQTSIYVGKYYIYRPYDETTVSPQAINFESLKEQPFAEGYESSKTPWKALATSAIIIGDKWTDIVVGGRTYGTDPKIWDEPGIGKPYKVYAAFFSNQTGLDLTYDKNNPKFAADAAISGATDINFTCTAGSEVGAAHIYKATVQLAGATNAFKYAPVGDAMEPIKVAGATDHSGTFWADKKNVATAYGFTFDAEAPITLIPADAENGLSTGADKSKAWFWFNSLPVIAGDATEATTVTPEFETSYGTVTINTDNTLKDVAYAFDKYGTSTTNEWIKLSDAADAPKTATAPANWKIGGHNTFVNQYGNHKGKYVFTVDFSKGVMNDMCIKNDAHLQKLLKYYLASGKTERVRLNLDKDANGEFKISKISIALLQTINRNLGPDKVLVRACTKDATHTPTRIVITQDGQTGDLASKKEVPALNQVFQYSGNKVYLSKDCEWTWAGGADGKTALPIDAGVASITNEGTLTVNATNVELSVAASTLANAKGATMNITKVTTVKNALTNLGTINVPAAAELRAYGVDITNDAQTKLMPADIIAAGVPTAAEVGVINNSGVVGVSAGTGGQFFNYGKIVMQSGAMTFLTSNELSKTAPNSAFENVFGAADNKMGTVVLPEGEPDAIVSVSNTAENGFIMYNWTAATYEHATENVKYNTIIVSNDIKFQGDEFASEIQFIVFNGNKTKVVNPGVPVSASRLNKLKGIIVNDGKSFILEKKNRINCKVGAYLGAGATIYRGGAFLLNEKEFTATDTEKYFGDWYLDQIVEY